MDPILKHGIVYPARHPTHRKSAVRLDQNHILAPGSILIDSLKTDAAALKTIRSRLLRYKIIDVFANANYKTLQTFRFNVITRNVNSLAKSEARILYIFNSKAVSDSFDMLMDGFKLHIDLQMLPNYDASRDYELMQLLLSSFVILRVKSCSNALREPELCALDKFMGEKNVYKLDKITCVSTPFGNESFFGTVNEGIISNIIGKNNCLVVASMPLVFGCEGAPIFDAFGNLIGTVIVTTFKWNKEIATLSLVVRFSEIIKAFLQQKNNIRFDIPLKIHENRSKYENCTVLIQHGVSWGTGCLLRVHNRRMVITCSHVVSTAQPNALKCTYVNGEFSCKIVYANHQHNLPYDIAILDVPDSVADSCFANCELVPAVTGQTIFSVGFPHFVTLGTSSFSPSIFEGRITKADKGIIFTDASVQAGQSGGPIFTETGTLLGICVCNAKEGDQIYPMINMCIPIYDIYRILAKFSETNDPQVLRELNAEDDLLIKNLWNLNGPFIMSKL